MPWPIADTDYDNTHPWDSLFNSVPLSDVLKQDPRQQKLMAQAIQTANPATPEAFIRECMTNRTPGALLRRSGLGGRAASLTMKEQRLSPSPHLPLRAR